MQAAMAIPGMTPAKLKSIMDTSMAEVAGPGGPLEIRPDTWKLGYPGSEREVTAPAFVRGPRTLRQFYEQAVKDFGRNDYIIFRDERHSLEYTWQQAAALGSALVSEYGVRKGDRVACAMRNSPEWCITWIAATSVGAVIVPMNSWWQRKELEYGLSDSGAKVLVCDDLILGRIAGSLAGLRVRAILNRPTKGVPAGVDVFADVVRRHFGKPCPDVPQTQDDTATIMYTSGTTGNPKGVVQTQRGVCSQMCMMLLGEQVKAKVGAKLVAAGMPVPKEKPPQQCAICPVPLFHVTASHHIFLGMLGRGGKLVLMEKWEPGHALKLIERERATIWTGVPTMIRDLMEHPDFSKTDTSSLQGVGGGGAATPPSQVKLVTKKFKGQPSQGYGMTETNGAVAMNAGDAYVAKPESTGAPFPIVEAAIVDLDSGKRLGAGQKGELWVKSPLNLSHYWGREKATKETIVEIPGSGFGWVRTGDVAELDKENFIYIRDRAKDIIIRGGENISCAEVEGAIFTNNPDVLEAACFGVKDPRLGEVVGVMVQMSPGVSKTAEEIVASLKGKIAAFKIPPKENVFFVNSPLPRGATGKTLKRAIRDTVNKELSQGTRVTTRAKL